jgi:membrane-associated phospholipid phosphatase
MNAKTTGYWATVGIGMTLLALATATWGYEKSFLVLNGAHFALGDAIFPHLTHLGDGVVLTSLLMLALWRQRPDAASAALIAVVVSAVAVNFLKFAVFDQWRRPMGTFSPENVRMLNRLPEYYFSFPSGHSATAGAGFTMLAFAVPKYGTLWGTLAFLTAYSRIYVGSHFPADVLAGFGLGAACSVAAERFIVPRLDKYLSRLDPLVGIRLRMLVNVLAATALMLGLSNRYFGAWVG